ncbi:MAG TPA: twin-arginine translocation pathway signal [Burkholderiaceae bacterium]|nr:twin-arginine translocation pathway signal [Burkholderiaceae bacterium]
MQPTPTKRRNLLLTAGTTLALHATPRWVTAGSSILSATSLLAAGTQPAATQTAAETVLQGPNGWLFAGWENLKDVDVGGIRSSIALLARAQELFQSAGIRLVLVVVPMKAVVVPHRLPAGMTLSDAIKARYGLIQSEMTQAGLLSVDGLTPLLDLERQNAPAFYRTDYHWTSAAAEATADAAARVIKQHLKLPPSPAGGAQLGEWVTERHHGDLASKFLSPRARKLIGRDVFRVRLPPDQASGLLDDEAAPVHVMGNSFVQPYWGFSQRISNQVQTGAALTWNAGNVGQWAIALKHANEQLKGQRKPSVLVWQMNEAQVHIGPQTAGLFDAASLMAPETWVEQLKLALST